MQMTMQQVINIYPVFNDLSQQDYSIQVSYWIMKNLNLLTEDYNFFINERTKLYEQYLQLNENDSYITPLENGNVQLHLKDASQSEEFIDKFNSLLSMECDIEPFLIKLDVLIEVNMQIPSYQLNLIKDFILE